MARTSNYIEFIKDKVGKYFIKANSIATDDNVSLEDKVKYHIVTVSGTTNSGASLQTNIDANKYVIVSAYSTGSNGYFANPFAYNGKYMLVVQEMKWIVNDQYGVLGVFNRAVSLEVVYRRK